MWHAVCLPGLTDHLKYLQFISGHPYHMAVHSRYGAQIQMRRFLSARIVFSLVPNTLRRTDAVTHYSQYTLVTGCNCVWGCVCVFKKDRIIDRVVTIFILIFFFLMQCC